MKVKVKKFIAFLMLILTIFSVFSNTVFATEISSADLKYKGDCGYHLQYWDKDHWSYIITSFVTYSENGKEYGSLPGKLRQDSGRREGRADSEGGSRNHTCGNDSQ